MTTKQRLSREEVLGGLGGRAAKQAHTLLALIENRTAQLVAQAHQVANPALAVAATQNTPRIYLEALAQARADHPKPSVQELERYAPQWAMLVPENPAIRATLAHLLGQNYPLIAAQTPAICAAVGVATVAVQEAYQRLYQQPLATIFAPEVTWREGLRWRWAAMARRLEALPPFWLTFFLTMPGVSGLLALPIALATVAPLWGVLFILLFGLVNMLTVAALAETVMRSGTARFGLGFLGQLAQEYLGQSMSVLVTLAMAANNFVVLIIFFLGIGGTLAGATGLPIALWMLLPFFVTLFFLSRRTLNATVTTNLLIVFVNLLILLAIPLLALPYLQSSNLIDPSEVQGFTPAALELMIGILSSTFLSHFLVATYGPVVLPRDPSGRGWLHGSMAAVGALTLIACLWLVVLTGVLSPQILRESTGTVITPLAARVGPAVNLLGSLLVTLSLGLTTIQVALAQYYSVEERLPRRGSPSFIGKLREPQRFGLAVSPMLLILLLAEWLAVSGAGSFASLLGILGALLLPLLIGILPLLLLVATQRKGDLAPPARLAWLGHPLLVGLLYLFFIGSVLLHGLYIWQAWPLRLLALGSGVVVLVVTWVTWRQGLTRARTVVEVRHDEHAPGQGQLNLVTNGAPLVTDVTLDYGHRQIQQQTGAPLPDFAALQSVTIWLPTLSASLLKVWLHQLPVVGGSVGLPAQVTLSGSGWPAPMHLSTSVEDSQQFVSLPNPCEQIEVALSKTTLA
ncbi:MAG: hypothetical protein R3C14_13950 [Caldilineaceae bacterium]